MNKDKRLHIVVDKEMYQWLKDSAYKYSCSVGHFVRRVLLVEKQIDEE